MRKTLAALGMVCFVVAPVDRYSWGLPCSDEYRLGSLDRAITDYDSFYGSYPRTLIDLVYVGLVADWKELIDSYGRPYFYRQVPPSYEVLSAGDDGIPGTSDDIELMEYWEMCKWPELEVRLNRMGWMDTISQRNVAAMILKDLDIEIDTFCILRDRYPKSLDELELGVELLANCTYPTPLLDPWGRPYSYRLLAVGYELYSNGPDGVPNTADDVLPGVPSDKCRGPGADVVEKDLVEFDVVEKPVHQPLRRSSGCGCARVGE